MKKLISGVPDSPVSVGVKTANKKMFMILTLLCLVWVTACNDADKSKNGNTCRDGNSIVGTWELIEGNEGNIGRQLTFYEDGKVDREPPSGWGDMFLSYVIRNDSLFCEDNDVISIGYTIKFSANCNLLYTDMFTKHNCDTCFYEDILRVPYHTISGIYKRVR